ARRLEGGLGAPRGAAAGGGLRPAGLPVHRRYAHAAVRHDRDPPRRIPPPPARGPGGARHVLMPPGMRWRAAAPARGIASPRGVAPRLYHAIAACPSAPRAGVAFPVARLLPGSFAENEIATVVAAERLGGGTPERAGRNQRARGTALGQGSSP